MTRFKRLKTLFHRAAEQAAPDDLDLWPQIAHRLRPDLHPAPEIAPRRRGLTFAAVPALVGIALLLVMTVLAANNILSDDNSDGNGVHFAALDQQTPTVSPPAATDSDDGVLVAQGVTPVPEPLPSGEGEWYAAARVGRFHLRTAPSNDAPAVALLGAGMMPILGQTEVDGMMWYYVSAMTEYGPERGWVSEDYVELERQIEHIRCTGYVEATANVRSGANSVATRIYTLNPGDEVLVMQRFTGDDSEAWALISVYVDSATITGWAREDTMRVEDCHTTVEPLDMLAALAPTPTFTSQFMTPVPQFVEEMFAVATGETQFQLRESPSTDAPVLWLCRGNEHFTVLGQAEVDGVTWYYVRLMGGAVDPGWVRAQFVELTSEDVYTDSTYAQAATPIPQPVDSPTGLLYAGGNSPTFYVYEAPDTESRKLAQLNEYAALIIAGQLQVDGTLWYSVHNWIPAGEGREGWVQANALTVFPNAQSLSDVMLADFPASPGQQCVMQPATGDTVIVRATPQRDGVQVLDAGPDRLVRIIQQTTEDSSGVWWQVVAEVSGGATITGWVADDSMTFEFCMSPRPTVGTSSQYAQTGSLLCISYPDYCVPYIGGALVYEEDHLMAAVESPTDGRTSNRYGVLRGLTSEGVPVLGNPAAPVTVEVWLDFTCPHCMDFYTNVLKFFIEQEVMWGRARVQVRFLDTGTNVSRVAAQTVICAGEQGAFWEMLDATHTFIAGADLAYLDRYANWIPELGNVAAEMGLDRGALQQCVIDEQYMGILSAWRYVAEERGVSGVPAVLVYDAANEDWVQIENTSLALTLAMEQYGGVEANFFPVDPLPQVDPALLRAEYVTYTSPVLGLTFDAPATWTPYQDMALQDAGLGVASITFYEDAEDARPLAEGGPQHSPALLIVRFADEIPAPLNDYQLGESVLGPGVSQYENALIYVLDRAPGLAPNQITAFVTNGESGEGPVTLYALIVPPGQPLTVVADIRDHLLAEAGIWSYTMDAPSPYDQAALETQMVQLPQGTVAVSILLSTVGVAGGDPAALVDQHVAVGMMFGYANVDDEFQAAGGAETVASVPVPDALVVGVHTLDGPAPVEVITLAVTPEEAEILTWAVDAGIPMMLMPLDTAALLVEGDQVTLWGCTATVGDGSPPDSRPLDGYTVLQSFGAASTGIDLAAAAGTDVRAVGGGMVVFAGWRDDGYGMTVVIAHGTTYTLYAHLEGAAVGCGDQVAAGGVIGAVGSTGNTTGPGLHFEVRDAQFMPRDPAEWIAF